MAVWRTRLGSQCGVKITELKSNQAERESVAVARHTSDRNACQNVPAGARQEHCTRWVLDDVMKPTKSSFSGFMLFFAVVGMPLLYVKCLNAAREASDWCSEVSWLCMVLCMVILVWSDAPKYSALGSFSLWLSASTLKLHSWQ